MAKKRIFDLPQTEGNIQLRGIVTGTKKDKFFVQSKTQDQRDVNALEFGVKVDNDSTVYVKNRETKLDKVYFHKRSETKGEKGTTKEVPYANYENFNEEGYNIIGMTNGLTRVKGEDGKEKCELVTLPNYDAIKHLADGLEDDMPVFIKGTINFGSYMNKKEEMKRSTDFVPTSVFASSPIDFDAEDFEPTAKFKQKIIFMGIEKDDTNKDDAKFVLSAKIVKYSTIEDTEFIIRDGLLAKVLKKNLKPYTAVDIWGYINNYEDKEEVEVEDAWGMADPFAQKYKSFIRELVVTGADPGSVDKETYTEELVDEALKAIAANKKAKDEFGTKEEPKKEESWGSSTTVLDDEEDLWG